MLSRLFIAALWSPAGLASRGSFVVFNYVLSLFLCDILGQVWYYLIVTVPDLGHLSYFQSSVDPYQIASSEANLSGSTLFSEKHK